LRLRLVDGRVLNPATLMPSYYRTDGIRVAAAWALPGRTSATVSRPAPPARIVRRSSTAVMASRILPPLVENGNTVPLAVTVESPMSETDFVHRIAVFNDQGAPAQR
jgi:hypothetical protein